ncbi:N-acetyltransferase family protein [Aquirhabdus sp.]|uniref:GNAT family N-acetyltransferase n=1 Tax=Aquirhabdus sp. TaxID=2824160 RepID=UPI00396C3CCE
MLNIRKALQVDFIEMWKIFTKIIQDESTYVFGQNTSFKDAFDYWFGDGINSYVVEEDNRILGMYKCIPNQRDLGSHIANASFMIDPSVKGKGLGKMLGIHCLQKAKKDGYQAMQFNFVVSTNEPAIALWKKLGFTIIGTIPEAFKHQRLGFVDAYIMHRKLDDTYPLNQCPPG